MALGGWEIVIILGVLLLLFGAKRLPDMARSVGQSARVFKGEMKGMKADDEAGKKKTDPAAAPQATLPPAQPVTPPVVSPAAEQATEVHPATTPTQPGARPSGQ